MGAIAWQPEMLMTRPGKKRASYAYALRTWNLTRNAFDAELGAALEDVKGNLVQMGIHSYTDLSFS